VAIIKHIASKNANYGAANLYLEYQHDKQTQRPILDEQGHYIPREESLISGILTTPEKFAVDCLKANLKYGQNQKKGDVKSHHYILAFDPRDREEHGLTLEEVQKIGEQFCKEHFPGHQALVCSHPDGHHQAGNLHCHIVINSVRIQEVPRKDYMDRPADSKEGAKHRCTGKFMRYLREQVMKLCKERGLYQVDLLSGAAKKITDKEYHAQRSGQEKLDKENALLIQQGKQPEETIFDTQKEELRQAIDATWRQCSSLDEFVHKLFQEYGVEVTESRGRFSYLHPNSRRKVADRRLGEHYRKGFIEHGIEEQNYWRKLQSRSTEGAERIPADGVQPCRAGQTPAPTNAGGAKRSFDDARGGTKQQHRPTDRNDEQPRSLLERLRRAEQKIAQENRNAVRQPKHRSLQQER
jgi:hypothetical protein